MPTGIIGERRIVLHTPQAYIIVDLAALGRHIHHPSRGWGFHIYIRKEPVIL